MQPQKQQNDLRLFPRQTIQHHSNPSLLRPTHNAEEAEVHQFFENSQHLLELTPKKDVLFIKRGLECKSRKSRDTWNKKQIWRGVQNEAEQRLTDLSRKHAGYSKLPFLTTQEMILQMNITG